MSDIPASICTAKLNVLFKAIIDEAKDTSREWADDTMTISKENFCPVDTGALKSTGQVKTVVGTDKEYKIELSYGKGLNYAIPVHEIPKYHEHGQDQYLSTPFNLRIDSLMQDLKIKCGEVLR